MARPDHNIVGCNPQAFFAKDGSIQLNGSIAIKGLDARIEDQHTVRPESQCCVIAVALYADERIYRRAAAVADGYRTSKFQTGNRIVGIIGIVDPVRIGCTVDIHRQHRPVRAGCRTGTNDSEGTVDRMHRCRYIQNKGRCIQLHIITASGQHSATPVAGRRPVAVSGRSIIEDRSTGRRIQGVAQKKCY